MERRLKCSERLRARLNTAYFGAAGQIPKPTAEEYRKITSGHGRH